MMLIGASSQTDHPQPGFKVKIVTNWKLEKFVYLTSLIQEAFIFCSLIVSYLLVANESVAEKTNKIVVIRALREGQGLRIRC